MEAFVLSQHAPLELNTLDSLSISGSEIRFETTSLTFHATLSCDTDYLLKNNCLYWLLGQPELSDSVSSKSELLQSVACAYEQHGPQGLNSLKGHFLVGVVDVGEDRITLINDKFCTIPLYYTQIGGGFSATNKLSRLAERLPKPMQLNKQALYNYVYFHCIPAPYTVYQGVNKLEPHRSLVVNNAATYSLFSYWKPSFSQTTRKSNIALAQELRNNLQKEIGIHGKNAETTGAFLSGGLDSSTVTAYLAKNSKAPVKTFTIGFSEEGYDESGFADIVAKAFETDHHVRYVTPEDIYSSLPSLAAYYDEPFGNSSALPAYFCAKEAKAHGITTLLAGDGGDELFAGNDRYAKQKLFLYWENLPSAIKPLITATVRGLQKLNVPLSDKAASYIYQAEKTVPERLQFYNFLHQNPPSSVFTESFLKEVDPSLPDGQYQARWNEIDAPLVDRMLYLDWKFTLADNDLVKVNNMTAMAGVKVVYPLLGESLLQSAQDVPPAMKLPGKKLRDFYKYALAPILPNETINKTKHGFGLPFGKWLIHDASLKQLASDALDRLKKREIFQVEFIETAERKCHEVHASYYGELVWIMMMLELWLQSHEQNFS
ncbi:MAG: asparagine synthase [Hahellaceae bacterium]|nr:asparagine synthase [Hahellaceae bacterium]